MLTKYLIQVTLNNIKISLVKKVILKSAETKPNFLLNPTKSSFLFLEKLLQTSSVSKKCSQNVYHSRLKCSIHSFIYECTILNTFPNMPYATLHDRFLKFISLVQILPIAYIIVRMRVYICVCKRKEMFG